VKLSKPVRDLINNSEAYIDDNDFTILYNKLHFDVLGHRWEPEYTGEFRAALLDAEIFPLDSMGIVPGYYLCGDTETTAVFVPSHVHIVEEGAFMDSSVEELDFGENVTRIEQCAPSGCKNLWRVVLHNKIEQLSKELFYGDDELKEIVYKGTKHEWLRIHKDAWNRGAVNLHTIICDDGEIEY
jgi:hypothetical protein